MERGGAAAKSGTAAWPVASGTVSRAWQVAQAKSAGFFRSDEVWQSRQAVIRALG